MRTLLKRYSLTSTTRLYGQSIIFILIHISLILYSSQYIFPQSSGINIIGAIAVSILMVIVSISFILILKRLGSSAKVIYSCYVGLILLTSTLPFTFSGKNFLGDFQPYACASLHVALITFNIYLFQKVLKDIFRSEETKPDHIWGAIVGYFVLLMIFAEIYEMITIFNPDYLGQVFVMGLPNYIQCVTFSLSNFSGLDPLFPDAHGMMKKIASLQSVIGNLYIVVILGRLLSHPMKSGEEEIEVISQSSEE